MEKRIRVGERIVLYHKEVAMETPKASMSIAELLEAAKNTVVNEEYVAAANERLRASEEKFEKEKRARNTNEEWFDRRYTI